MSEIRHAVIPRLTWLSQIHDGKSSPSSPYTGLGRHSTHHPLSPLSYKAPTTTFWKLYHARQQFGESRAACTPYLWQTHHTKAKTDPKIWTRTQQHFSVCRSVFEMYSHWCLSDFLPWSLLIPHTRFVSVSILCSLLPFLTQFATGDFFPAAFNCPHEVERHGALGDGGKWVCGLSRLKDKQDCVVYSFGMVFLYQITPH